MCIGDRQDQDQDQDQEQKQEQEQEQEHEQEQAVSYTHQMLPTKKKAYIWTVPSIIKKIRGQRTKFIKSLDYIYPYRKQKVYVSASF